MITITTVLSNRIDIEGTALSPKYLLIPDKSD